MTPEEKFNQDVWCVLKRVKERSLYTRKDSPIDYWVDFDFYAAGYPSAAEEAAVLGKLEEWGVIKIHNRGGTWDYM